MLAPPVRREETADPIHAIALAIAVCGLAAAAARAADPAPASDPTDPAAPAAPAPPVRRVGEVTAHATRGEREVLDVPGNVTVIDREEIERSGVRSVPELLRRQPGIFVTNTTTNPAGSFVDARGFNNGGGNGAGLLVLVDGRRANEPDTGSADWALLPLDMVESIEIVRGPASALYGDGAVGGVLHIRTRPLEGPPRGVLRGLYGRYDTAGGSLRAAGSFGEVTAGLFADGLVTDGYRDRSEFDGVDVKGSLEASLFDRLLIGSSGGHHHDDRSFPGNLTFQEIDAFGRRSAQPNTSKNRGEVDTWYWDGWAELALGQKLQLRALPYFFERDDFLRDVSTFFGFQSQFEIENQKRQGGVDLELRLDRPLFDLANRLTVGAGYLRDEIDRNSSSGAFFSQRTQGERHVVGGFAQEELWLRGDLLLAAGVRYDDGRYDLRTRDELSGATAQDEPRFHAWSPKASLTWRFLPIASTYFAWSRGFRLPDFDEDVPVLLVPPLLPDLELQRSDSYEVGAKLETDRATAGLALYWMRVRDEILFEPLTFSNLNLDRVRHRGIEVSGSWRVLDWLTFTSAYTFDDVKIVDDDNPGMDGARMPITPRHRGSIGAFAELPLGFGGVALEAGANANLVGERIFANDFRGDASELDPYQTLDLWLRLGRNLGEHVRASFGLAVRNVTGERYEDFGAVGGCVPERLCTPGTRSDFVYPAAGRSYELSLVLELLP